MKTNVSLIESMTFQMNMNHHILNSQMVNNPPLNSRYHGNIPNPLYYSGMNQFTNPFYPYSRILMSIHTLPGHTMYPYSYVPQYVSHPFRYYLYIRVLPQYPSNTLRQGHHTQAHMTNIQPQPPSAPNHRQIPTLE